MAQINQKGSFLKNYGFLICMIIGIVAGCIVGAVWPGATALEPIGTIFINMMFCVVVPMVFVSISSAIANMKSARRAGKVRGTTIATFCVTAAIAAVIMYVVARCIPLVVGDYPTAEGEVGETLGVADMIVNFFTKPDFTELFSRRAILPLIVAGLTTICPPTRERLWASATHSPFPEAWTSFSASTVWIPLLRTT